MKVDFDSREKSCDGNIFFCDKPERLDLRGGHPMPYYYSLPGGHPEFIFSPPSPLNYSLYKSLIMLDDSISLLLSTPQPP